jgi:hypothetical protein
MPPTQFRTLCNIDTFSVPTSRPLIRTPVSRANLVDYFK